MLKNNKKIEHMTQNNIKDMLHNEVNKCSNTKDLKQKCDGEIRGNDCYMIEDPNEFHLKELKKNKDGSCKWELPTLSECKNKEDLKNECTSQLLNDNKCKVNDSEKVLQYRIDSQDKKICRWY